MPYRRLPNSMPAVLRCLIAARDEWKNTPNAADRAISADQWAQLDDTAPAGLLNRFITEAGAVNLDLAGQGPVVDAAAQSAARLTLFVSHFHQGFDRGVARGTFTAGAREYYGRDIHSTSIPDLSTFDAVQTAAQNIVDGEAARATAEGPAGYVAMALPSAAEVDAALTAFKALHATSGQAQSATSRQRKTKQGLYPQAQALAVDICDTVEFFYRKDASAANRRADCRRWGVVFASDAAAAPAPPTPPAGAAPAK